jgi:hypothetical protein
MGSTRGIAVLILALGACGSVEKGQADAAPDDPDGSVEPQTFQLVMNAVEVPTTSARVEALAQDIDGNGAPDNSLGQALSLSQDFADLQSSVDAAIGAGVMLSLIELGIDGAAVEVRGFVGADGDDPPDPTDNFSGSETFSIVPGSPTDSRLPGSISAGRAIAGPGTFPLKLALPDAQPIQVLLHGARVEADVDPETGELSNARLGGALTEQEIDQVLIPALTESYQAIIARDCPNNQCVADSAGQQLLDLFDVDDDGALTVAEVRNSDTVGALVAPDLDLFDNTGAFNPNIDGINDTTSMGIGFATTGASFAAP